MDEPKIRCSGGGGHSGHGHADSFDLSGSNVLPADFQHVLQPGDVLDGTAGQLADGVTGSEVAVRVERSGGRFGVAEISRRTTTGPERRRPKARLRRLQRRRCRRHRRCESGTPVMVGRLRAADLGARVYRR